MPGNIIYTDQFVKLIKENERLIYKVCNIYQKDADERKDLFQEIVLQAWTAYPRFKEDSRESTWLYRIALNTAITHKRKSGKSIFVPFPEFAEGFYNSSDSSDNDEQYRMMEKLIQDLPDLEKALILLYLEDRNHTEIAEIMGISLSNVGTRLARIREKLKKSAQTLINS